MIDKRRLGLLPVDRAPIPLALHMQSIRRSVAKFHFTSRRPPRQLPFVVPFRGWPSFVGADEQHGFRTSVICWKRRHCGISLTNYIPHSNIWLNARAFNGTKNTMRFRSCMSASCSCHTSSSQAGVQTDNGAKIKKKYARACGQTETV